MSTLKADAVTTKSDDTDLTISGGGTGKVALGDAALLFPDADGGSSGDVLQTNASGVLSFATPAGGGFASAQAFTATGTWTKPAGINLVKVTTTAAGGGGGGNFEGCDYPGGAGGAGATAIEVIDVSSVSTVTVTIGAAGAAGAANTTGAQGGTSSFGSYHSCTGGYGGSAGADGDQTNLSKGVGGTATGGDVNIRGGYGGYATEVTADAGRRPGANGGGSYWGGGGPGNPGHASSTDHVAVVYGSGGGGGSAQDDSSTGVAGENGAAGFCLVEEFK